jgi:hypothetical protein
MQWTSSCFSLFPKTFATLHKDALDKFSASDSDALTKGAHGFEQTVT